MDKWRNIIGYTWQNSEWINMDNEEEKGANDDSYASSLSNWTDGIG